MPRTFGKNIQTIGTGAFKGCTGLTGTLTIPATTLTINSITGATTTLQMAVTPNNYLKPTQSGWTEYSEVKTNDLAL